MSHIRILACAGNYLNPDLETIFSFCVNIMVFTFFIFFMLGHIVFDMGDQGFDIGIHPFSRVNKLMLFDFSFQRQKFPPSNSRFSV